MGLLLVLLIGTVVSLYVAANIKYGLKFESPQFHHANQVHVVKFQD